MRRRGGGGGGDVKLFSQINPLPRIQKYSLAGNIGRLFNTGTYGAKSEGSCLRCYNSVIKGIPVEKSTTLLNTMSGYS